MAQAASPPQGLSSLRRELDPGNSYSPRRFRVALRVLGLQPGDLAPVNDGDVQVSSKIPDADRAERVKLQRLDVWDGLRESRMEELRSTLASLSDADVARFDRTSPSRRRQSSLPSKGETLAGMEDFEALQERKREALRKEQQRKADLLVTGFLTEKKRMEESGAKIAAFEKRLQERKREEEAERKQKRAEAQKREERLQQQVQRAAQERREWEEETEGKLGEKLQRAARKRKENCVRSDLQERQAAAQEKRSEAFQKALEAEEDLMQRITERQERMEERLDERSRRVEEEQRQKAEASKAEFQRRQMQIYETEVRTAEEKLAAHRKFQEHMQLCRGNHEAKMKERSKSVGDISRKARDKWRSNYEKEQQRKNQSDESLMERHQAASEHAERLSTLRLKCGQDIHTHTEVKYGTWGELQKKRQAALTRSREAARDALLAEIADFDRRCEIQAEGRRELERRRQEGAKASLALKDQSREGFLKIQCESDERKIHSVLTSLGFDMPSLPDEDEELFGEEQQRPAF